MKKNTDRRRNNFDKFYPDIIIFGKKYNIAPWIEEAFLFGTEKLLFFFSIINTVFCMPKL